MKLIGKITFDNSIIEDNTILFIRCDRYELYRSGFNGYIFENSSIPDELQESLVKDNIKFICGVSCENIMQGDIAEIDLKKNSCKILYKINSNENVILTTNQCNNNCIMCPDTDGIRKNRHNADINQLKLLVELMDDKTKFVCITGGEPTLLKENLFDLLESCKRRLNNTEFIMLTNGRAFYYENYTRRFLKSSPTNIIIGIPLHSYKEDVHDFITRVKGSFTQTFVGIKNLLEHNQLIELRVVINKFNYLDLNHIAEMISEEFPDCYRVNFMAMEILGNAYLNVEDVWVDFDKFSKILEKACMTLLSKGIRAYIYNIPLCYVDKKLWSITKKSITEYKIKYGEECGNCKVKDKCGGFFYSTKKFRNLKGIGIS